MSRAILFYDTETTGFPKDGESLSEQPHMVQLAAILVEESTRKVVGSIDLTISDVIIPDKIVEITGVTNEYAQRYGVREEEAFWVFRELRERADLLVGHNVQFDEKIVGYANQRYGNDSFYHRQTYCTMQATTPICKLPGRYGKYKWPKLVEAYQIVLGKGLENAHTALADTQACMELYFHLEDMKSG